ncbi:MAG TPA: sulfatase [Phycisphaeraceae bacterium]
MSNTTSQRPNFIFIVGEDTGRLLGCYGDRYARTPHLDRLASEGCRFDEAYTTCPVCAPARSTLVTGQYPTKIGTHQMRSRLLDPPRLFTHELRDAGYYVSWPTKLDFNFQPTDGWCDDDEPWLDRLRKRDLPAGPWFFYVNLEMTHESRMWPDDGGERPPRGPRPPAVNDPDEAPVPPYLPDTPVVRRDIARHYDNIAELDRQVGEILAALDASGQAERTVVVFLADHGRGLPREKRWTYTAGLHMPLIVRWPQGLRSGAVDRRLVSWVDIAPTFLSLAGVPIPPSYDGQVFLGRDAAPPREFIFAGRDRMDEAFDRVRIARDHRWHYVRNFYPQIPYAQRNQYMEHMPTMQELRRLYAAGQLHGDAAAFMRYPKPPEELYDLQTDPWCLRNLADDPARGAVKARLAAALEQWLEQTNDLGAVPERDLIARGLVEDQLQMYRKRIAPLPKEHQVGLALTVLEPSDLEHVPTVSR